MPQVLDFEQVALEGCLSAAQMSCLAPGCHPSTGVPRLWEVAKCGRHVTEAKWHEFELPQSCTSCECSFASDVITQLDLPVLRLQV